MAIVENRSTEIGDVIRIQTEVPIIGVISLNGFLDSTEGETMRTSSPGDSIPLLVDSRKFSSFINFATFFDDSMYVICNSNDGTQTVRGIARYDLNSGVWDADYPDATENINRMVFSGGFFYAINFAYTRLDITATIRRLNITTRVWQDVDTTGFTQNRRGGSRVFNANASKVIYDNKIWMSLGIFIVWYDIVTDTWGKSTGSIPVLTTEMTTNPTTGLSYLAISPNERLNDQNDFIIYNPSTDSFDDTVGFRSDVSIPRYYAGNGLIYAQRDVARGVGDGQIVTYNPVTDGWINTIPIDSSASQRFQIDFEAYNDRLYVIDSDYSIRIFNIATNQWVTSTPASRFFQRQFRYSVDGGMSFTPFMDLTMVNIQNIEISQKNSFVVDISYERSGSDVVGELQWNSTTLLGQFQAVPTPVYDSTFFKLLFEVLDPNVLGWALNVLEKIYQRGLLPDYVDRNQEGQDDQDFINYWYSVTHLFAILVYWMRNFENIPSNRMLLTEFLRNFDITLPFDLNLQDEATIYSQRTDEYRRRGTSRITVPATDPNEDVNGELLRLIDWVVNDFFLFALTESSRFGWCLGLSSPTWTSTTGITNLVMGYESTANVVDLSLYPLVGSSNIAIVTDTDISENVMAITSYAGVAGTYGIDTGTSPTDNTFLLPVNHLTDYEISFKAKKLSTDNLEINFRAYAYDADLNSLNLNPVDGAVTNVNNFQSTPATEVALVEDTYYTYTGILYSSSTSATFNLAGRIGNYRGLRLPSTAVYIGVGITVQGDANRSDFYLYDIKIRPKDLPISQGLLGVKNIIVSYMSNDGELSDEDARLFIQNSLIPYNSFLIPRWLVNE